jgi:TrmH family RNA methyltransferase
MLITSLQNPKVKGSLELRERRERDRTGLFLIEGYREFFRFLGSGGKPESVFYCPPLFLGENEEALLEKAKSAKAVLYECSEPVFRKLSYRDRPDGIIATAKQPAATLEDLERHLSPSPFLVIAEAIEKPGNLGTILRSSDACGVDGVIVCDKCTDVYNPNVVRASVGTLFTRPVIETTSASAIEWLKKKGIAMVAATPHASLSYTHFDWKKPVAVVLGTEQTGLSKEWMEKAEVKVRIPMCGVADSLNVAMAATVLLYEGLRQRNG